MARTGAKNQALITGRIAYGHDGSDAYPFKVDAGGGASWFLGQPEIRCDNEGWGKWESKALQAKFKDSYDTNRHFRYGNWAVHLNGGPQASEEAWASISVPVNDLLVKDLARIEYTWYNQVKGTAHIGSLGPNLVFSAYDPDDHSKRVDFNTLATQTIAANPDPGWHEYLMTSTDTTEVVYWYGNNTGGHSSAPPEGGQTQYWSSYIGDTGFKDWVIYRIQVMHGYWGSTRSAGDVWIGGIKINGSAVKWEPSVADQIKLDLDERNMFGTPALHARGSAHATWSKEEFQKGGSSWTAKLHGGAQSGDDWAAVYIPVNEMPVPDLKTALWTYKMSSSATFGVNMVIWVHDPFNLDYRAEITQQANTSGLGKAAGWNAHELNPETAQFYYYGEEPASVSNLTEGAPNYYAWNHHTVASSSYVTDELFNTWTIYRVSFEYGWEASGTFADAYMADVQLNGKMIPMGAVDSVSVRDLPQREPFIFRPGCSEVTGASTSTGAVLSGVRKGSAVVTGAGTANQTEWGTEIVYGPIRSGKIDGLSTGGIISGQITIGSLAAAASCEIKHTLRIRNTKGSSTALTTILFLSGTVKAGATTEIYTTYDIPYLKTVADFNSVPFGITLGNQSQEAGTAAVTRIMESSYIQGEFEPGT